MTLSHLKDFGDWLSPIIVKELRQGMRTRLFTTSFIVLQGFMVLFMLNGLSEQGGKDGSDVIWFLLAVTLLIVMPLRGFGALSSEIRLNTMDLIALTRMSAWRITAGKWAAQVSQSILLTMAVLPYVVIRYFFGGVNIVAELFYLGLILLLSCLLSAVMVGFSAFPNFLVRSILAVGVTIGVCILIGSSTAIAETSASGLGIPFSDQPWAGWFYLGFLVTAIFLMYYFLDMGASRIAPEAVNYSTRRRLISLAYLALLLGTFFLINDRDPLGLVYGFAIALISLFAMDALTERPSDVRSLHFAFVRFGPPGQLLQFLFAPGWLTGIFYVVLMGAMLFATERAVDLLSDRGTAEALTLHVSLTGTLLFPLLLIHLFSPKTKDLFSLYFFIQLAVIAAGLCIAGIQSALTNPAIMWAGCPIPFVCFLMSVQEVPTNTGALLILACISLLVMVVIFLWHGWPHVRAMLNFRRRFVETGQGGRTAPTADSEVAKV